MNLVPWVRSVERISSGQKSALIPEILKKKQKKAEVKPLVAANQFFRKVIGTYGTVHHATTTTKDRKTIKQGYTCKEKSVSIGIALLGKIRRKWCCRTLLLSSPVSLELRVRQPRI
jgi:hypothetical protein